MLKVSAEAEIKNRSGNFLEKYYVTIHPPASKTLSLIPIWFTVKTTRWKPESPMS
jgi:hypothetical protein